MGAVADTGMTHTNFRVQFPMYRLFVSLIQSDDPGKFEKAEFNNY